MSRRPPSRVRPRRTLRREPWRLAIAKLWPSVRSRRRALRAFQRAPRFLQVMIGVAIILTAWLALNWVYQVIRKPSELFFPVSGTLYKTPPQTRGNNTRRSLRSTQPLS